MLATPFEHAARAPVPARIRPGLLKYRVRYRRAPSKPPCEYELVQDSSRQSVLRVLACRSQLVSSAQRDRSPLGQIWFDTVFQYIIHLVLFFNTNIFSAFSNIILRYNIILQGWPPILGPVVRRTIYCVGKFRPIYFKNCAVVDVYSRVHSCISKFCMVAGLSAIVFFLFDRFRPTHRDTSYSTGTAEV